MREKVKRSRPSFATSEPVRRIPPSKKVLDERRPPAPWILLTEDPEPSPAPPEGGEEVERLRAALAGEGEAPSCTWTMDEDGVWHTGCGASLIYIPGGTPDEHGQRFCHACGKSIAAAAGLDDEGRPSP